MAPTLLPGDWLLVNPDAFLTSDPTSGDLVLVPDPRDGSRLLVKRVAGRDGAGDLVLAGDDPMASTDSRDFGAVDVRSIQGRPLFRYWPPARIGRLS